MDRIGAGLGESPTAPARVSDTFPVHTTSKYRVTLSLTVYTYVASFIRSIPACTGEPRQSLPNVL